MKQFNLGKVTDEKIKEAEKLIRQNGGNVYTDNSFLIKGIKGKYGKSNLNELLINITDKPFFLGWGTIENQLAKFFN